MILKNKGDVFLYAGIKYVIGEKVIATKGGANEGMIGTILQICDGEDKETENYTPDIYCSFDEPILKVHKEKAIERLSKLWDGVIKLEDANVEQIIMAPEMIIPLDSFLESKRSVIVYALIEESCADCNTDVSVQLFADKETALQQLEINLKKEFEGGMLDRDLSEGYVFEESEDSYECYLDGFAAEWRYYIHIEEQKLVLTDDSLKSIGKLETERKYFEDFEDQICCWDEMDEFTEEEYRLLVKHPDIPKKIKKELDSSSYWETYHEAVCDAAHKIVKEELEKKREAKK